MLGRYWWQGLATKMEATFDQLVGIPEVFRYSDFIVIDSVRKARFNVL